MGYGLTDELTPTVSVERFQDAVVQRGYAAAVAQIGVAESTVRRWTDGKGLPEPRYWERIAQFVRYTRRRVRTV